MEDIHGKDKEQEKKINDLRKGDRTNLSRVCVCVKGEVMYFPLDSERHPTLGNKGAGGMNKLRWVGER